VVSSAHKNENDIYDYKTLLEFVLIADTKVTQSKRESLQILDLLGEIGGFQEAIFMVMGTLAFSVSAILFQVNIAESYYLKKRS
jgi:hypothetical protein